MTLALAFGIGNPPLPPIVSPTAARDRLIAAYQPVTDRPIIRVTYSGPQKPWAVQVWADGHTDRPGTTLSEAAVKNLLDRLRRENTLDMVGKFPAAKAKGPEKLFLQVHLEGGDGEFTLGYSKDLKPGTDARRILRIWADILTVLPSPNGEKPIQYLEQ